jgi:ABC-2 type transport system ATP-binding protein
MDIINIQKLCKNYGDITALDNINLTIKKGTIFGLLGENGAGKTTLISILNGLIKPNSGEITIFNESLRNNLVSIRGKTSLIPQSLAFYENLSVRENLMFFAKVQKIKKQEMNNNLEFAIETNGLSNLLSQKASTLSGGQKRRLNIAIGLLNNPEILFFDEPTVGIDPAARNSILETISNFKKQGKTIIYTTHYMNEIEKICDNVAILHEGQLIEKGTLTYFQRKLNNKNTEFYITNSSQKKLSILEKMHKNIISIQPEKIILQGHCHKSIIAVISYLQLHQIDIKKIDYNNLTLEDIFLNITSKKI